MASLSPVRLPVEKPLSALAVQVSTLSAVLPHSNDPFLYNPRKLAAAQVSYAFARSVLR